MGRISFLSTRVKPVMCAALTNRQIVAIVVICMDIWFRIDLVLETNTLVVARLAVAHLSLLNIRALTSAATNDSWPRIVCSLYLSDTRGGSLWHLGEESGKLRTGDRGHGSRGHIQEFQGP